MFVAVERDDLYADFERTAESLPLELQHPELFLNSDGVKAILERLRQQ